MSDIRNHFAVVQRLFQTGRYPLTSPDTIGTFIEACAVAIHAIDPEIGHIRKAPGRTQYRGHAVDALLHRSAGQSIDLIIASKAASPSNPARITWAVDPVIRYGQDEWMAPEGVFPGGDVGGDDGPAPVPTDAGESVLDQNLDAHNIPGSAGRALLDVNNRTASDTVVAAETRVHADTQHDDVMAQFKGTGAALEQATVSVDLGQAAFLKALKAITTAQAAHTDLLKAQAAAIKTLTAKVTASAVPRTTRIHAAFLDDVYAGKVPWLSKTILFNALAVLGTFIAAPQLRDVLGPDYARWLILAGGLINIVLRMRTSEPIDMGALVALIAVAFPAKPTAIPPPSAFPPDTVRTDTEEKKVSP